MQANFRIQIHPTQSDARITIRLLFALIRIPLHFRLVNRRGEDLRFVRILPSGKEKILLPKQKPVNPLLKKLNKKLLRKTSMWLKLHSASMYIRMGSGNPARDCLLCGAARELFLRIVGMSQQKTETSAEVQPDFANRVFILKFTGIIRLSVVKIILIALKKTV